LLGIVARYIGSDEVVPTVDLLRAALELNPSEVQNIARQPLATMRDNLIDDYISIFSKLPHMNERTVKIKRQELGYLSVNDLRDQLAILKANQQMAATPVSVHRQNLRDAQQPVGQTFPTLPPSIYEDGKFITIDAQYMKQCSGWAWRQLLAKYGEKQCMARRQGQ